MDPKQVNGVEAVLKECIKRGADIPQTAYILATAHGETGGRMQPARENMSYTAERIRQVWPSRFPSVAAAKPFERNPVALANKVYNGRMGNVIGSNDGWLFRGNGIPQLTGRENHAKWGARLGINLLLKPELMNDLSVSVRALVQPMLDGWATGLRLDRFVSGQRRDYTGARAVWGGVDAAKYAALARAYEAALAASGYTAPVSQPLAPAAPNWLQTIISFIKGLLK